MTNQNPILWKCWGLLPATLNQLVIQVNHPESDQKYLYQEDKILNSLDEWQTIPAVSLSPHWLIIIIIIIIIISPETSQEVCLRKKSHDTLRAVSLERSKETLLAG